MTDRGSVLALGDYLSVDDVLRSASGEYIACLQRDGALVVYRGDRSANNVMWTTDPARDAAPGGESDYFARVELGGGLVLSRGTPLQPRGAYWESGKTTASTDAVFLWMRDDGHLTLYAGSTAWTTAAADQSESRAAPATQYKLGKAPPRPVEEE